MDLQITGKTKIMFILADPVAHIRGSVVLTRELRALGHDIAISPLHVKPADLERTVQAIRAFQNVVGFGITIPHKIAVAPLIDELLPQAKLVIAADCPLGQHGLRLVTAGGVSEYRRFFVGPFPTVEEDEQLPLKRNDKRETAPAVPAWPDGGKLVQRPGRASRRLCRHPDEKE